MYCTPTVQQSRSNAVTPAAFVVRSPITQGRAARSTAGPLTTEIETMTRWILGASAALLLFTTPAAVWANAGPPRLPGVVRAAQEVKLVIVVDDSVKAPRLEVPQGLVFNP